MDDQLEQVPPSRWKTMWKIILFWVTRGIVWVVIISPFIVLGRVMHLGWWGFGWLTFILLFGGYLLTGSGITIGFHRYFTHKSFETSRAIKWILGILGGMALEGPICKWAATHRQHHHHSDEDGDPHSPHLHGELLRGFFHSHMGWMLFMKKSPDTKKYVPDLLKDRDIVWIDRLFLLWVILGLLIPTLIGGLWSMSWNGALEAFIWGGVIRIFVTHHITWSINSVGHIWGTQPFTKKDGSRNNPITGVLGMGEGWHNNHHAFPTSARHGLRWWELDGSWCVIWALGRLRLVKEIRVPNQAEMDSKAQKVKLLKET